MFIDTSIFEFVLHCTIALLTVSVFKERFLVSSANIRMEVFGCAGISAVYTR